MLATEVAGQEPIRGFGIYNAVAATAGSIGALAAGGPTLLRRRHPGLLGDQRFFLLFVPALIFSVSSVSDTSRGRGVSWA